MLFSFPSFAVQKFESGRERKSRRRSRKYVTKLIFLVSRHINNNTLRKKKQVQAFQVYRLTKYNGIFSNFSQLCTSWSTKPFNDHCKNEFLPSRIASKEKIKSKLVLMTGNVQIKIFLNCLCVVYINKTPPQT